MARPSSLPDALLAGETTELLSPFEHGVIELFVRLADVIGVPKSVGEIYGLLFASARPLAFQDIIDRLNISKGSASQGLRLLRAVGAIKPVYVVGERRDYFVPETEIRALVRGFLREKVEPHLEGGTMRIKSLQSMLRPGALDGESDSDVRLLRQRIEKLGSWHRKGRTIIPVAAKLFG